ncbi:hypothetical protein HDU76_005304, partial [Blyttiomyces sp. JEL0837]
RGSFYGSIELPPPGGPPLPTGNFPNVKSYLHQLTQLGYLKPTPNTYYAIHFAPNTGLPACDSIRGYHYAIQIGDIPNQATNALVLGVVADQSTGCFCGASTPFEGQTITASHELIEAGPDPLGNVFKY